MIYLRKHEHSRGWYYLSIFGWQPFARFGHGGWVCLNWKWLRTHA